MPYCAVCFDIGNTLIRPFPSVAQVCQEVLSQLGADRPLSAFEDLMPKLDALYEELYGRDDTFWADEDATREVWIRMYSLLARELDCDVRPVEFANRVYDEFGSDYRWRPYDDVVPVLESLRFRGVKMAIISNWDTRLVGLLESMGLSRYFETIISSAEVGLRKPDPKIFQLACERLDVLPSRTVHVGDHHYADVVGAASAGLRPVLIDRAGAIPMASSIVSLHKLEGHLGWD